MHALFIKFLCFSRKEGEFSKLPSKNKVADEKTVGGRQHFDILDRYPI